MEDDLKVKDIMNSLKKILALMAVLTLILVVILGVGMEMNMDKGGSMTGCFFLNYQGPLALCPMSALEHMARWQEAFSAVPVLRLLSISLFALQLLYLLPTSLVADLKPNVKRSLHALSRDRRLLICFDYLVLAFSQGILHPKIFEPVTV